MSFYAIYPLYAYLLVRWHYFRAIEKSSNLTYAVKIIENYEENIEDILQEYKILFEHSLHPNIPMLFGAYRRVSACPLLLSG